jgi:hypothetical protein
MRLGLIACLIIVTWVIGMFWIAGATSDIPDECRADHPGPTPSSCFGDPPPWQTEGDAPERGSP